VSLGVFTFAALHERTSGLDGPTRMHAFYALPEALQRQAWSELAERMDRRSARDFEIWCRDGR
jgi:hypothetical protein